MKMKKIKMWKSGSKAKYESRLFDTGYVHRIDLRFAEADWADLLKNPANKTVYSVDMTIDGKKMKKVALSTKGVSSLVFPAIKPGNQRYSFKIKFGKNKKKQKYYGLDGLDLNCCAFDKTLMKDFFSYRLFRLASVPAPLASYAWVTVNGKDHGLYLVIEKTNESFLKRNYGKGVLYKPTNVDTARTLEEARYLTENGIPDGYDEDEPPKGADLTYIDDNPLSYPNIFQNRKTAGGRKDEKAVIASMKRLAEGRKLKKGVDVHEVIRFFAAHNFLLSFDSYTGGSFHNFLICEKKGIMSVIPWDYNLIFCTYINGLGRDVLEDPTKLLNQGIDRPLVGVEEKDLPLWRWIMRKEKYRKEYHEVLSNLLEAYFESGIFECELNATQAMLAPYEEKDPYAFYTAREFRKGGESLRKFFLRRAEIVRKQLKGELATVSMNQNEGDRVAASDLNVEDLGIYDYLPKEKKEQNPAPANAAEPAGGQGGEAPAAKTRGSAREKALAVPEEATKSRRATAPKKKQEAGEAPADPEKATKSRRTTAPRKEQGATAST